MAVAVLLHVPQRFSLPFRCCLALHLRKDQEHAHKRAAQGGFEPDGFTDGDEFLFSGAEVLIKEIAEVANRSTQPIEL